MNKEEASLIFKALGDPNRLKIVKLLQNNGEICACKLLEIVNCKQSTLSHHLSVLEKSGLIKGKKEKKNIIYSCNLEMINMIVEFLKDSCNECKGMVCNENE